jgi:hypothetical protein
MAIEALFFNLACYYSVTIYIHVHSHLLILFFLVRRNYISAKWYGFTDPQSGIDKLSWRIGTKPGSDDILRSTHLPVSNILVEPDLPHPLPTTKRIYITIKAYNKAGMFMLRCLLSNEKQCSIFSL